MSGSQKALKVISILLLVWGILMLLLGVFLAAGSQVPGMSAESMDVNGTTMNMATAAIGIGVGTIVAGVVYVVIALLGLRGAKNPRKAGAFFVLCIIGLVLSLISLGMGIAQGTFQWQSLIGVLIIAVCTYLASAVKKQA